VDVQRPLYGLATDLTPFAVVGPVTGVSLSAERGLTVSSVTPTAATAIARAAPLKLASKPPVHLSGRKEDPAIKVAVGVAGVVFVAAWMPAAQPTPSTPVASAQAAPVESAGSASRAETSAALKVETKAVVQAQHPQRAQKRDSQAATRSPSEPRQSRPEPEPDLASTLERFRGGMR
jgi:hypothetical protein